MPENNDQLVVTQLMNVLLDAFELKGDFRGFDEFIEEFKEMEQKRMDDAYKQGLDDAWEMFYKMSKQE